jgi:hypothetical protein
MKHLHTSIPIWLSLTICALLLIPGLVKADTISTIITVPDVLISEVMPDKTAADKTDEFIELYNNSNKILPANSLQLQMYASTATAWADKPFRTVTLSQDFLPGKHYLVASGVYLADTAYDSYGSTLTAALGHIRVVQIASQLQEDYVEWGDPAKNHVFQPGNLFATVATYPGTTSQSLKRKVNEDGLLVYSGNSSSDFMVSSTPSPEADNVAPDGFSIVATMPAGTTPSNTTDPAAASNLQLTELLPDPAAPQTDADNEFIEVFNGSAEDLNIKGYILETFSGSTVHDYTVTDDTLLAAGDYHAFFSSQTHLALSNSGGQVRLLDPQKRPLSQTAAYPVAVTGQSWALLDGTWTWAETPTPGTANIMSLPSAAKAVTTDTKVVAKIAKPKIASTPGNKKAAVKKVVAKKKKIVKTTSFDNTAAAMASAPIHTKILATVATVAVLYGLYEYRHDLSNRYQLVRANRAARRAARAEPKGRRSVGVDQ